MIILPTDPEFWDIIHSKLPPKWWEDLPLDFNGAFGVDYNTWLLKPMGKQEETEYLLDGEYDALDFLEDFYLNDGTC